MKNEWKVAPLEMSKKLVELGVVLDTEKNWEYANFVEKWCVTEFDSEWAEGTRREWYPAPDVSELIQILTKCSNWEFIDLMENMAEYLACIVIEEINEGQLKPEDLKL